MLCLNIILFYWIVFTFVFQTGDWTYSLTNTLTISDVLTMTVTSRAVKSDASTVSVTVHTNKDTNAYPSPMIVYARLNQDFSPILGANVTAIIEPENGDAVFLDLLDNGAGNKVLVMILTEHRCVL